MLPKEMKAEEIVRRGFKTAGDKINFKIVKVGKAK